MLDVLALEVLVPFADGFGFDQVTLVDNKQEVLLAHLLSVVDKVAAVEEQRVSAIDDLHKDVRPIHHSPQLPPHLQVLFVGRDRQLIVLFFDLCQLSSPVQIGLVLCLFKGLFVGCLLPLRPAGHLDAFQQLSVVQLFHCHFLLTLLVHADDFLVPDFFPDLPELDISVGVEVLLAHLRCLQELTQRVLLQHRLHLHLLDVGLVLLTLLVEHRGLLARPLVELSVEFVLQGLPQTLFLIFLRHLLNYNSLVNSIVAIRRGNQRHTNRCMNFLWKSDLTQSLMKLFFSSSLRAWLRKTVSSYQRLLREKEESIRGFPLSSSASLCAIDCLCFSSRRCRSSFSLCSFILSYSRRSSSSSSSESSSLSECTLAFFSSSSSDLTNDSESASSGKGLSPRSTGPSSSPGRLIFLEGPASNSPTKSTSALQIEPFCPMGWSSMISIYPFFLRLASSYLFSSSALKSFSLSSSMAPCPGLLSLRVRQLGWS